MFRFPKVARSLFCCNSRKRTNPPAKDKRLFRVLRIGITGRFALFLLLFFIVPMTLTAWMIESGYLMPGRNVYLAIPVVILFVLIPFARLLADFVINRDLRVINRFCTEIKRGNYGVYFDLGNEGEEEDQLIILCRNLTWMSHGLEVRQKKNRTLLKKVQNRYLTMEERAHTDELTGLYNRRYFETLLLQKAKDTAVDKNQLSLIFIDCDKFKRVNDTLGHHVGDLVLKRLADSIRAAIRGNSDIPFRFGGDEFAILLPETGEDIAVDVAGRIRMLFSEDSIGETSLSIGVASSYFVKESLQVQMKALVCAADQQAYRVKENGGNGICSIKLIESIEQEKEVAQSQKQSPLPNVLEEEVCKESQKEYCKDCLGIAIDKSLAGNQIVDFVRALVTHSNDGVIFIDRDGLVMGINSTGLGMLGYVSEDVVGRSWSLFKPRIDRLDCLQDIRFKLLKPGHWRETVWYERLDGSRLPLELHITVVQGYSEKIGGFCVQFRNLIEIKSRDDKLYKLAHYDTLTGLPNRNLFVQKLQQAVVCAGSQDEKVAVFRLHIENFRHIREIFYPDLGDLLIGQVTERINSVFHTPVTVSRYCVDEFALLIENLYDLKVVALLSRKIIAAFQTEFHVNGYDFFLTVSVGSAVYPNDANDAEMLMCNAGLAMFRAKQEGKNSSCQYIQKLSDLVHNRYDLCKRLRRALKQDEISVWYQPQIDIKKDSVCAVEALIRWEVEPGKYISPNEFISVAEETGIILELGQLVLKAACRQAVLWLAEGIELRMAVNISARQLQQVDFAVSVSKILEKTGLAPEMLELEITETMMMENRDLAATLLLELKDIGIRIAIDDFGSGYSSLAYLKQFPFKTLKIDRAFVMNLPDSGDDIAITSTILNMAASLDLEVVAEGVETVEQLKFFKERGCDMVQGYLFSKPRPPSEISGLLRQWITNGTPFPENIN